jgi:ABC-type phosphate transport system substrate-binding protein
MRNVSRAALFLSALILLVLSACSDISFQGKANDVPTAGQIRIGFEPGDSFLVSQWLYIFHSQYPKASITPVFEEKETLVALLLADSLQGIFIHDTFSKEEQNWLADKKNATVNEIVMGSTSPVFVASKNSEIRQISFQDVATWNTDQIETIAVRSRNCSEEQAIQRYINRIIADTLKQQKHPYGKIRREIFPTDKAIVEFVATHSKSIGIVSLNAIADKRDSLSMALQQMVRIVPVQNERGEFHLPFHSQISAKQYPIIQPLVSYETQGYSGLVKGFVIYANSQAGQALLQKSGLLPANYQGRKIQIDIN